MRSELGRLAHWDGLVAELTTPVIVTDVSGRAVIWNPAATALFGWQPADVLGRSALRLLVPHDLELDAVSVLTAVAAGEHWTGDLECTHRDGSLVPIRLELTAVYDDERVVIGFVGEASDRSEIMAADERLRAADARQRASVARSRDATLFFDADGTICWASPVAVDVLRVTPDALLGQNGLDFVHADDRERVFAEFVALTGLGDHVRTEFRITDTHGDVRWIEEDATNLLDDPDVGYIVANIRDITERKHAQQELELLALRDPITGLPNRSLLVDRLEQLIERGSTAAILSIDVDNFSDVNDSLGHAAGDCLLRLIGVRFSAVIADSASTLARVGSDEFALLCDEVHDATAAFALAERLRESLRLPFHLSGEEVIVTVSVGVALSPGDAKALMREAGIATQLAKQQGRDRVVVFDARLDVTQQRRLAVQGELRHALANDELVVCYQPILDLKWDRVVGVEALVRWNHPQRGLLGPERFIDVAETSGLICALGIEVLHKSFAAVRGWRDAASNLAISINAAAAQLSSHEFVDEIEAALEEYAIDPAWVTIEITETAAMRVANSMETLDRIRRLGLHLSLDDFGTGYSSLSFLRDLPVDAIKIDRSFVSGLGTNPRDTSIVQGVIAMAEALGFAVVGEGVETVEQAKTLRRLGCRYAQGFLWSRAVPGADVVRVVEHIRRTVRDSR